MVTRTEKSIRKPERTPGRSSRRRSPPRLEATNYFFDDALGEITVEANNPKLLSQEAGFDLGVSWSRRGGR